jgi:hypothetical protein
MLRRTRPIFTTHALEEMALREISKGDVRTALDESL